MLVNSTITRDAYDSLARLNWSRLWLLNKSPAHFRAGRGEDSDALSLGTAVHAAVLEPEKFETDFITYPGKVRRGHAWEEFEEAAMRNAKTVLSRSERAEAEAIRDAVRGHVKASSYLKGGASEVTIQWEIKAGDLKFECKGRVDYLGESIVDLKSTRCASIQEFAWSCSKYGYYGQAAWYSDGYFLATGKRLPFRFIAVETSAPYLVTVFRETEETLAYGRDLYMGLLAKLDYCNNNNFWGGYIEQDEVDLPIARSTKNER